MEDLFLVPLEKKRRTDDVEWEEVKPSSGSLAAPVVVTLNTNDSINTRSHDFTRIHNASIQQQGVVNTVTQPRHEQATNKANETESHIHRGVNGDKDDISIKEGSNEENRDDEDLVVEERTLDWEAIRQHPMTREHVEQYLNAKHCREQAQARFDTMLDDIHAAYMKCIDSVLDAAGQVHQQQRQDTLDAMEAELIQLFVGNDRMRTQMQRDLERSSKRFQYSFFNLMASLQGSGGGSGNDEIATESPTKGDAANGDNGQEEQEPDWEAMMQRHPVAADGIRRFLASRERLESVDAAFGTALDDVNMSLKANFAALMDSAIRIHEEHAQTLDAMEDRLLDHFEYNHRQRTWMHQHLEQSAQKAQERFASLMSRLHRQSAPGPKH